MSALGAFAVRSSKPLFLLCALLGVMSGASGANEAPQLGIRVAGISPVLTAVSNRARNSDGLVVELELRNNSKRTFQVPGEDVVGAHPTLLSKNGAEMRLKQMDRRVRMLTIPVRRGTSPWLKPGQLVQLRDVNGSRKIALSRWYINLSPGIYKLHFNEDIFVPDDEATIHNVESNVVSVSIKNN